MPVDDGLLRQVRLGQYSADVVRVVLDMQSAQRAQRISPYRTRTVWSIELQGQKGQERVLTNEPAAKVEATAASPWRRQRSPIPRRRQ